MTHGNEQQEPQDEEHPGLIALRRMSVQSMRMLPRSNTGYNGTMSILPESKTSSAPINNLWQSNRIVPDFGGDIADVSMFLTMKKVNSRLDDEYMDIVKKAPRRSWLINPHEPWRTYWDILILICLVYTATITPFEIAFLEEYNIFLIPNILITIVFALDIVFNFFIPFKMKSGEWEFRHSKIALNYAKGFLIIDIVSIIPYSGARVVRLLRLSKLLRVFQGSTIMKRWETKYSLNHLYMELWKYIIVMVLLSHWLACLFRIILSLDHGDATTWDEYYFVETLGIPMENVSPMNLYLAALYWAVMTVTTIGYGDVIARTNLERIYVVFAMLIGAGTYGYCVGSVCSLIATMGETKSAFVRKLDRLNILMEQLSVPRERQQKLREFLYFVRDKEETTTKHDLLSDLSPMMRDELRVMATGEYLKDLYLIKLVPLVERQRMLGALCSILKPAYFPPHEDIITAGQKVDKLRVIKSGTILRIRSSLVKMPGHEASHILDHVPKDFLENGMEFGVTFLLAESSARFSCTSMTYVELLCLDGAAVREILDSGYFPFSRKQQRRNNIRLALMHNFVQRVYTGKLKPSWSNLTKDPLTSHSEHLSNLVKALQATRQEWEMSRAQSKLDL